MPAPTYSIVVPTHHRPDALRSCLRAIGQLDYPRERYEVIVVDDANGHSASAVTDTEGTGLSIRLITARSTGPAAARNRGAAAARGRRLAFIDDDCSPASDWLRALDARVAADSGLTVAGRTINALGQDRYAVASHLLLDHLFAYYNPPDGDARFATSSNLSLAAELFRRIGGFDESFPFAGGEDREFCARLLAAGHRFLFAPEVVVHHRHALTLRSFVALHFRYGRGAALFHHARGRKPQLEPPAFYVGLVRRALSQGGMSVRLASLVALSQLLVGIGYAVEARRQRANQRRA